MFPIPWNKLFRKKDGSIITIDDAIQNGGGQYELPTASASTKGGIKIGSGLAMNGEVLNNSNPTPYSLPTASADTLGGIKVGSGLSILDGVLSATSSGTKIYYKEYTNVKWQTNAELAKFSDGAASASGIKIAATNQSQYESHDDINIAGYTPIAAIAWDRYTGYTFGLMMDYWKSSNTIYAKISYALSNRSIDHESCGVKVFYVANSDLEALT